jgi:hypothetical protein
MMTSSQHLLTSNQQEQADIRAKTLFLTAILGFLVSVVFVVIYGVENRTIYYSEN